MTTIATYALGLFLTVSSLVVIDGTADERPAPARIMNGRVYNDSSSDLRAWASGTGFITVPARSKTGDLDVDHVLVCGQWYKICYDGWVRVYDGCRLSRLGTQCKANGPGRPCADDD